MHTTTVYYGPSPKPTPPTGLPQPSQWLVEAATGVGSWICHHPWLATAAAVIAAAAVTGICLAYHRRVRRRRAATNRNATLLTITPPPQVDPAGSGVFWATMAQILRTGLRRRLLAGRRQTALEYRWTGRQLAIAVWIPSSVPLGPVQAAIRGAWPGASCTVERATAPLPLDADAVGGCLAPTLPVWYRLHIDHDGDPLRTLIAAASNLHADDSACLQLLARPATSRQVRLLRRGVASLRPGGAPARDLFDPAAWLAGALRLGLQVFSPGRGSPPHSSRPLYADPQRERDARASLQSLDGPHWQIAIRYAVAYTGRRREDTAQRQRRLGALASGFVAAFGAWTGRNRLRRIMLRHPARAIADRVLHRGFLLTTAELASIAALPQDLAVPGLDRARAKPMPAPVAVAVGGRDTKVLGRAELGGHSVAVKVPDARQHLHVVGSTGSGKSTLLLNMILDDIHARRGTIVIDPKGDLVVDLLDRIPARLARRLVLLDPDQPDGTTLNPLAGDDHNLATDNVVSIFGKIFAKHWGPRMDDMLRVTCLTLLRKANATMTLIPSLLQDRRFRHQFTADLDDPEGLLGFWEWYESAPIPQRSQVIAPLLSRLRSVLLRPFPRRTFGAAKSSFDMADILDGGILLARLPKGQIGEETTRLMGSFVLASAWQAATARARLPEDQRRDACVYVDEAHNFLNLPGSVGDMLAEARGYRFGLVLAHQNLAQMPRETQLAISANARNKIFFSCAPEDAHQLARHTLPELDEHDLSHMDAFRAACRLVVDGRESAAFTLRTNPTRPVVGAATAVRQAAAANGRNVKPAAIARLAGVEASTQDTGREPGPGNDAEQ
ncbi:type IV secretion system DNA-binding domain-containing protein [Phytohabitans houttuyneae]|uniref:Helicase HerA central domain-containing protein n=1 Tax=Phytohabitans houttuyneae TaxID=1076126 RepID=A0A6V8KN60_9ACTN|nr:type IV secretion system DNA-binding domain-containing protein [Phytohabitans houttuyneae]GFJ82115.1 hypothetical protein Phou_062950 [Phytohabitans houttuyneae]